MAFKINDLDKFLTEDYEDFDEPTNADIEGEMEKFADVPESDVEGEEGAVPSEAAEEGNGFEMEQEGDGKYIITQEDNYVCRVELSCQGNPIDMATVENPSECEAKFSAVERVLEANVYAKKLEDMGFKIIDIDNLNDVENLPESKNYLIDTSNRLLED